MGLRRSIPIARKRKYSVHNSAAISLLLLVCVVPANAQTATQERHGTATAGFGNAMGWFGVQGERYWLTSRLSVFAGIGYTPDFRGHTYGSGAAGAFGVRGYTRGFVHRGFVELSVSQLFIDSSRTRGVYHRYGPGVQWGYQFVSTGGFTFHLSLGAGRLSQRHQELMGGIGVGYTWRRRTA